MNVTLRKASPADVALACVVCGAVLALPILVRSRSSAEHAEHAAKAGES